MKSTPTTKPASVTKKSGKRCVTKEGSHRHKDDSSYGIFLEEEEKSPARGKRKRAGREDSEELDEFAPKEAPENSLALYLNEIGKVSLLSKEGEAAMGQKIRAAFGALLEHLLQSGFVLEVLLARTEVEMSYASTPKEVRAALAVCLEKGGIALAHAREVFARDGCLDETERDSLKNVFLELLTTLDFWQNIGVELLEVLIAESARVAKDKCGDEEVAAKYASKEAFCAANLMASEDCERLIKGATGLKSRALVLRNELMEKNLRLVVAQAARLRYKMLNFNEMIQEGNLGLMLAAERFDERKGNRFSTFAVSLIQAKIKRESDNSRMIRVPVYQNEAIRRLDKVRVRLEGELGREVSPSEWMCEAGLKPYEFVELCALKESLASLHQLVNCDGESTLEQVVPDPETVTPFYEKVDLSGRLDPYLAGLEETERRVVCCLFGLGGMPCLGEEETSKLLGLGQADLGRVRKRALEAMRGEILSIGEFYAYACAA